MRGEGAGEETGVAVRAGAMRRSPSGPCQTAYRPAITASRTCAVQMLRGRLLAADVLLAGLQGEAVRRCPVDVHADPDEPTRE